MGKQDPYVTNLRVVVVGCTPLARRAINVLKNISDIVGIVGLSEAKGRNKSNYDGLGDFSKNFDMLWVDNINAPSTAKWLLKKYPDIIIQCGWSQIFRSHILHIPRKYCIGIHPSPLPDGRGAAVINWKMIESDGQPVKWGNSLFVMEPKTDTGAVLDFEPFTIEVRDNIRTAYQKVESTSLKMIRRTIPIIALDKEILKQQENSKATRYYKRKPEDGKINLSWSAIKINDYVRSLTHPYPGAFVKTKFGKLFIWKTSVDTCRIHQVPGSVCRVVRGRGVLVKVAEPMCVWFERVSWKGDEMWADDWATEVGLREGDNLK